MANAKTLEAQAAMMAARSEFGESSPECAAARAAYVAASTEEYEAHCAALEQAEA